MKRMLLTAVLMTMAVGSSTGCCLFDRLFGCQRGYPITPGPCGPSGCGAKRLSPACGHRAVQVTDRWAARLRAVRAVSAAFSLRPVAPMHRMEVIRVRSPIALAAARPAPAITLAGLASRVRRPLRCLIRITQRVDRELLRQQSTNDRPVIAAGHLNQKKAWRQGDARIVLAFVRTAVQRGQCYRANLVATG